MTTKITSHVESRKKPKTVKKKRKFDPYYIGETNEGGDEDLCPCRCICNPMVAFCCCFFTRLPKLECLLCCRCTNYCLYRFKLIMCVILAIPKIILDFIKHIVCCLGFILTLLGLAALLIFLLRTFCEQIMSFVDFIFFSGGSMMFPFSSYYYSMISNLYDHYTTSTGQPYSDLIFTWNESVPNISTFLSDFLDMIAQVHKRLFSDQLDQQSIEHLTVSLAQRIDYLYQTVAGILQIFLETDVSELSNLSFIFRNVTTTFIQNQVPISQCFTDYPQLGLQCLLIGSIVSISSQQSFQSNTFNGNSFQFTQQGLFNDPYIDNYYVNINDVYNYPGNYVRDTDKVMKSAHNRNLLFFGENDPMGRYKYEHTKYFGINTKENRMKTKIDSLVYVLSFVCNNLDIGDCILCNNIKPIIDNITGRTEAEVKRNIIIVISEFIFKVLPKEILSRFNEPQHLLYSKEFQFVFHKLVNLHGSNHKHKDNNRYFDSNKNSEKTTYSTNKATPEYSVLVNDHRMTIDYFTWLKANSKEFNGYTDDTGATTTTTNITRVYRDSSQGTTITTTTTEASIINIILEKIVSVTTNGNTRIRDRKLLVAFYPPIVSCFNTLPPDPLCIIQGFLPLPLTTTGVLNTIVTALGNFDCDCTDLGYSEDPFWTVIPLFKNTWLIFKTIISGIFTIPVFSSIISSVTLPSWIENTFFISSPGTPLTADEILCAIIHLDSAIILLMATLVLLALLGSVIKAICRIIQCCAQLRMLRELLILSRQFIITPKYIDIIENRVRKSVEKDSIKKRHTRRFSLEIRTLNKLDTTSRLSSRESEKSISALTEDNYDDGSGIIGDMMREITNGDMGLDDSDNTVVNSDVKKKSTRSEEEYKRLMATSKTLDLGIENDNNVTSITPPVNNFISSQFKPSNSDNDDEPSLYEKHRLKHDKCDSTNKKSNSNSTYYENAIKSKARTVKELHIIKTYTETQGIYLKEEELLQWYSTYHVMNKRHVYGKSKSVLKMIPAVLHYEKNTTKSHNSNWTKFGSMMTFNSLARAELYPKSCVKAFTLCTYYDIDGGTDCVMPNPNPNPDIQKDSLDIVV